MPSNQLENLAKLIRSKKQEAPYTVLLGSGLSLTLGMLKELGYENWDTFYETMQRRSPSEWYGLLKEPFNTLHLQEGYRCLLLLLKAGYFNIALTANLDPLLKHAIEQVGLSNGEGDVLIRGEHTISHITTMLKRPQPRIKICMLRGQLDTTTSLKISETLQLDEDLEKALKDYLTRDMIVLGASNQDADIIRNTSPQGGSLWLVSSEPAIPDQWKLLQHSRHGETITGEEGDFNRFFSALAEQLDLHESKQTNERTDDSIALAKQSGDQPDTSRNPSPMRLVKQLEKQLDWTDDIAIHTPPVNGTGKHWGIVVGVTEHEDQSLHDQLEACRDDAEMLYQQLICCSFHPTRLHLLSGAIPALPDKDAILSCLDSRAQATSPDDLLLFYYSGVVDEDDNDAYLIVSYSLQSELQNTAIPMQQVKDILISSPAQAKVILLDICYAATSSPPESNEDRTEKFIQRIFTQAEGLTILAAHQKIHERLKCSVFTYLILEHLKMLATSPNRGVISVPTIYHDLRKSTKLYLSPSSEAQNAILCRYYNHDPDSFLISAYLYVIKAQNALENAQKVCRRARVISQDTCRHLHTILDQLDDPPLPEGVHHPHTTLALMDNLDKLCRRVNRLICDIVALRRRCEIQQTGTQAFPQPISDDLKDTRVEVEKLADKLRHELISEDIDR